eukprot:NODE_510_length_7452_cov_0.223990.p2 type:complete len:250 gc:universal NODE_510_length_7452_cov_0.223990:5216-5965(+)
MTTRLIQRIDNLQLEIRGLQIKIQKRDKTPPALPIDVVIFIIQHLNFEDLMEFRLVNKEFNLASNYILKKRSLEQLSETKRALHEAECNYAIVKQSIMPDIHNNLEFLKDQENIQRVYSQFGQHKDNISNLIVQCLAELYDTNLPRTHFKNRKFKKWFFNLELSVEEITDTQVSRAEDIIRDNDITYELARSKGQFAFRLLIIVAALLELQKLRTTISVLEFGIQDLLDEHQFLEKVIVVSKYNLNNLI